MKTALVLSAGGMFGAWQAGAWKALREAERPDIVVGSSVGALNGWAIAGGCTPEELIQQWLDPATAGMMKAHFPRKPWNGIFDPRPLQDYARRMCTRYRPRTPFAGAMVELPGLRLSLVRGDEITWRHLMAMCAVPLGYPPVRIGSRYYVDGGLLNALPLWAAAEMGATRMVALNALPRMPSRTLRAAVQLLRWFAPAAPPRPQVEIVYIEPSRPLGSVFDLVRWDEERIRGWIALGESDLKLGLCRNSGSIA